MPGSRNSFTDKELHVIDVALTEFWSSLDTELSYMEADPQTTDEEIDQLTDIMDTTDDLIEELADIIEGVPEYV